MRRFPHKEQVAGSIPASATRMIMKTCSKCKISKSLDEFPTASKSKNTKEGRCKTCKAEYKRFWYSQNRDYLNKRPNTRYNKAKHDASRRKLSWELFKSQYLSLLSKICYYCDEKLPDFRSGLDRLDNSVGYSLDNVVPCCSSCNIGRNTNFTPEEWKIAIQAVMKYRKEN